MVYANHKIKLISKFILKNDPSNFLLSGAHSLVCNMKMYMLGDIGSEVITELTSYSLKAAGPHLNAFRLLRAMQLERPLLLEGAPGVGKTSLVTALAQASGHNVVRINLSEHTVRR